MKLRVFAGLLLLLCADAIALEYFPLRHVRLLDGPFLEAQDRDIEYMLAMEPDRLLAPYLEEAGLESRADKYGNWESTGLDGHMGGHYLSALSLAYAATGRQDLRDRLQYMLDELQRAQKKNGNGYLGGVPRGDVLWRQIAGGDIHAQAFDLNGAWVPWYNLHKTFAGLRDAWYFTGSAQARTMLVALADWAESLVAGLSDEQVQNMLRTEHGGMNEVLADVAAITGDMRYLALARRFSDRGLLHPLLAREDRLDGLHANTQIPKVIGFERVADLANDADWHRAAEFFWKTVVEERSVAIGGNSIREHFNNKEDFGPLMREVEGPETCNTYNMLRLTRLLHRYRPSLEYVAYYERAIYNHILSSQDPATGGLVYFTPLRPAHYRKYSRVDQGMWCCVGSGIENHVKYGEFIYAHDGDALLVNLFIPSRVSWPEKGITVRQENRFPDESETRIVFEDDANIVLKLRYPTWAAPGRLRVTINGEPENVTASPGSYIALDRNWNKGDTVRVEFPMALNLERLPDDSDYFAILFGPVVLAARSTPFENETIDFLADGSRFGHVPSGPVCPQEQIPVFVAAIRDFASRIERVSGDELRFRVVDSYGTEALAGMELIPFFRLHRSRYMIYWPFSTPEKVKSGRKDAGRVEVAHDLSGDVHGVRRLGALPDSETSLMESEL